MYRNYEGHSIHATAWELLYPVGWEPFILVTHGERAKEVTKRFTVGKKFATRQEAETAGLAFAKSWIDDGKPDLGEFVSGKKLTYYRNNEEYNQ